MHEHRIASSAPRGVQLSPPLGAGAAAPEPPMTRHNKFQFIVDSVALDTRALGARKRRLRSAQRRGSRPFGK